MRSSKFEIKAELSEKYLTKATLFWIWTDFALKWPRRPMISPPFYMTAVKTPIMHCLLLLAPALSVQSSVVKPSTSRCH